MAPRVHAANAPVLERMLKATGAIGNDNFAESEHPVFRGTSPLARGSLKKVRSSKSVDTLQCGTPNCKNWYSAQCLAPISSGSTEQWHMGVTASMSRRQNFVLNPDLKWFLLISFHSSPSTKLGTCGREENRRGDEMKRHVISLHLTLSILMFHPPSLLFPHGHFETTFLSAQSLPNCSQSESAGQAHSHERRGVWLPGRFHALHKRRPISKMIVQS